MAKIEIYSTPICPYCMRAKALLDQKGIAYTDVNVMMDPTRRQEMQARSGGHTVPQIFVNDQNIGGCDELYALEHSGKLDGMLGLA